VALLSKLPPVASLFCHISLFGRERLFTKVALAFRLALLGLIEAIRGVRHEGGCLRRDALLSAVIPDINRQFRAYSFKEAAGYASERRAGHRK